MSRRCRKVCDGCALRRVRCDGGDPCSDCASRSAVCTRLRIARKRGPKGPRASTRLRIDAVGARLAELALLGRPPSLEDAVPGPLPDFDIAEMIHVFEDRLYPVWPVLDSEILLMRLDMEEGPDQMGAQALADALSAATIAQLRLKSADGRNLAEQAAARAAKARRSQTELDLVSYQSVDSVLISLFLHMYYANVQNEGMAKLTLREAVTRALNLDIHHASSHTDLAIEERQRQLTIYWILLVTERTYCAENEMLPILRPLREYPCPELADERTAPILKAFLHLARLFTYLESDFCTIPALPEHRIVPLDYSQIVCLQDTLQNGCVDSMAVESESQKLDIAVTRNWIRTLVWRHSILSCNQTNSSTTYASHPAFSLFYPVVIARDLLGTLAGVSDASLRAHGHGMELKLTRVANSMLNAQACAPGMLPPLMNGNWLKVLSRLDDILQTIGGVNSPFSASLRRRLAETDLTLPRLTMGIYDCGEIVSDDEDTERAMVEFQHTTQEVRV